MGRGIEEKYISCAKSIDNLYSIFSFKWFTVDELYTYFSNSEDEVASMISELVTLGFLLEKKKRFRLSKSRVEILWKVEKY